MCINNNDEMELVMHTSFLKPPVNLSPPFGYSTSLFALLISLTAIQACAPPQEQLDLIDSAGVCLYDTQSQPAGCMNADLEIDYTATQGSQLVFGATENLLPENAENVSVAYTWSVSNGLTCNEGPSSSLCTVTIPASNEDQQIDVSLHLLGSATLDGQLYQIDDTINGYTLEVPLEADAFDATTRFRFCNSNTDPYLYVTEPSNFSEQTETPYPVVVYFEATQGGVYNGITTKANQRGYYAIRVSYTRISAGDPNKIMQLNEAACAIRWIRAHSAWDENGSRIASPTEVRNTGKSLQIDPARIYVSGWSQGAGPAGHVAIVDRQNGISQLWNSRIKSEIAAATNKPPWSEVDGIYNSNVNSTWSSYSSDVAGAVLIAGALDHTTGYSECLVPSLQMQDDIANYSHEVSHWLWDSALFQYVETDFECFNPALSAAERTAYPGGAAAADDTHWLYDFDNTDADSVNVWSALSYLSLAEETSYSPPIMTLHGERDNWVSPTYVVMDMRYLRHLGRTVKTVRAPRGTHTNPLNGTGKNINIAIDFFDVLDYGIQNDIDVTDPAGFEQAFVEKFGLGSDAHLCPGTDGSGTALYCDNL